MKICEGVYLVGDGETRISNPMDCHVYLVDGEDSKCLVDAGVGINPEIIIRNIEDHGFDPKNDIDLILITHSHADHAGGARFLREFTGAQLVVPKGEADFIETGGLDLEEGLRLAKNSGIYPPNYEYQHTKVDRTVEQSDVLKVGSKNVHVIEVPGHSHDTAGFLFSERNSTKSSRAFFSGDIVFHGGTIGLGNWPGCNLDNYRKYAPRLTGLGVNSLFPGHFLWTLEEGQTYLDIANENLKSAYIPPSWTHNHPIK
jgi:hydroxyacylglutathione hydrolase